jgi:hypothetical protein
MQGSHHYDNGSYGIGRRTSMDDALSPASATYTYDARGRLTTLTRVISGNSYPLTTTYDAQDRVLSLTFPSTGVVSHHDGDHGKPVDLLLNGSDLVKGATYNALKKLTSLPLGNGLTTTWQYYGIDLPAFSADWREGLGPEAIAEAVRLARVLPRPPGRGAARSGSLHSPLPPPPGLRDLSAPAGRGGAGQPIGSARLALASGFRRGALVALSLSHAASDGSEALAESDRDFPVAHWATVEYPFNGQASAMLPGTTVTYPHRDYRNVLEGARRPDPTGVSWMRSWPCGAGYPGPTAFGTTRGFTGPVRDLTDDGFHDYTARYEDATVGKLHRNGGRRPAIAASPVLVQGGRADLAHGMAEAGEEGGRQLVIAAQGGHQLQGGVRAAVDLDRGLVPVHDPVFLNPLARVEFVLQVAVALIARPPG